MSDASTVMAAKSFLPPTEPIPKIVEKVKEIALRLRPLQAAQLMWDRLTDADRCSLGNNLIAAYETYKGTVGIYLHVRPIWYPRAVIKIARTLGLLSELDWRWLDRPLYRVDPTVPAPRRGARQAILSESEPEELIERQSLEHRLFLVQGNGSHRLYWRGERISGPWNKSPMLWEMLWMLAKQAANGEAVGWDALTGCNADAVVDRRSRLKKFIPPELNHLIQTTEDKGWYRLKLPASEIYLYEVPTGKLLDP